MTEYRYDNDVCLFQFAMQISLFAHNHVKDKVIRGDQPLLNNTGEDDATSTQATVTNIFSST